MKNELLKIINTPSEDGTLYSGKYHIYYDYYNKYKTNLLMSLYFKNLNITHGAMVFIQSDALLELLENAE